MATYMTTYIEKLKDPRWQKKRLEILERDEWTCQLCGDTENTLHTHHRRYLSGKDPWEYDNNLLVALCETCHKNEKLLWSEYPRDLIEVLKENFFGDDIYELTLGFLNLKTSQKSAVTAAMIKWAISREDVMQTLEGAYSRYLKDKQYKKTYK